MQVVGIIIPILFIILSSYIIWKSTDAFETAADYLGRNMSKGVKGATINAVASSMPEFLTTMFFLFYIKDEGNFADSFSGGLGVTAGSAIFNILIIPAAILLVGTINNKSYSFSLDRNVIKRDSLFLVFANIALIFILITRPTLRSLDGLVLIFVYFLYLFFLRKGFGPINHESKTDVAFETEKVKIKISHFLRLDIKQIVLNGKTLTRLNAWFTLILATGIMSMGTWLLVEGTELLGHEQYSLFGMENLRGLGLPIIFISVLLASAATSIPDTMISVRDAKKGNFDDSISNAFGSNIFDISFALGLPLLLFTLIHGEINLSPEVRIWSLSVWLMMAVINLVVIPVFIYSKKINRRRGLIFISLYLIFIFFVIEENTKLGWVSRIATHLLELSENFVY